MSRHRGRKVFGSIFRYLRGKRPSFTRRLLSILFTTALSLLLTIGAPFLLTSLFARANIVFGLIALILLLWVLPLTVVFNVFRSIALPLERRIPWQKRVYLAIVGYVAMILTYAGLYFAIVGNGDYTQAVYSNSHCEYLLATDSEAYWANKSRDDLIRAMPEVRPILGINYPIFLAVYQYPSRELTSERKYLSAVQTIHLAIKEREQQPRVDTGAIWNVFGECLHYSIEKATGKGSSGIIPTTVSAKLISDSEVLFSWGLLAFSVALVMGDRPKPKARTRRAGQKQSEEAIEK